MDPVLARLDGGPGPYLGHLLRTSLSAPGAHTSPIAGRVIAILMSAMAAQGDEQVVAIYLSPDLRPGATFTGRSYQAGDVEPIAVVDVGAAEALAFAAGSAAASDQSVEVMSRSASGLERCALTRAAGADLTFRFPDAVNLGGDPALCSAALQRWEEARDQWKGPAVGGVAASLREALDDVTVQVDLGEVTEVVNAGLDGIGAEVATRLASSLRPASAADIAQALAPLMPTAADVADLVTERLAQTVRYDLEQLVLRRNDALRSRPRRRKRQSNSSGGGPATAGPAAS